jgi:hypothetical protein
MLKRLGRQSAVRREQVKVGVQRPSQSVLEKAMTDEQELMLRAVLRNQEVIMNVLADLLTGVPGDRLQEQHRDNTLANLGTCVGLTHYYLEDLRAQEQFRESGRPTMD